jgi:N-acetylmuramoyl-L-alanine amidase
MRLGLVSRKGLFPAIGGLMLLSCMLSAQARTIAAHGDQYIRLKDVASKYGLEYTPLSSSKTRLHSKWSKLDFDTPSRKTTLNGIQVWLHMPSAKVSRQWSITETDRRQVVNPILRPNDHLTRCGHRVVVLDPGHGGNDRGARGKRGVEEKRVVLDIARRARKHLANAGLKVYLTRDVDRYISLEERANKAKRWKADLFVSIHLNASGTPGASGTETYVITEPGYSSTNAKKHQRTKAIKHPGNQYSGPSAYLGYCLQKRLLQNLRSQDRGLRRARFVVLKEAPCPAALVECGFLSNRNEESRFNTAAHREKAARALAEGILDYVNQVKRCQAAQ